MPEHPRRWIAAVIGGGALLAVAGSLVLAGLVRLAEQLDAALELDLPPAPRRPRPRGACQSHPGGCPAGPRVCIQAAPPVGRGAPAVLTTLAPPLVHVTEPPPALHARLELEAHEAALRRRHRA